MPRFQTVDGIPNRAVELILDAAATVLRGADFDRDAYAQAVFDGYAGALGAILDADGTPAAELLADACAGVTRSADACTATNLEHNLAVCDCDPTPGRPTGTTDDEPEPFHPRPQVAAEIAQDAAEADAADAAAGMPRTTTGPLTTADDEHAAASRELDRLRDEFEDLMRQRRTDAARDVLAQRDALLASCDTVMIGRTRYMVERRDSTETPYFLHGPRGACYALMRNVPNPSRLFMVNMRAFTRGTPDVWFRDDGGELRPC